MRLPFLSGRGPLPANRARHDRQGQPGAMLAQAPTAPARISPEIVSSPTTAPAAGRLIAAAGSGMSPELPGVLVQLPQATPNDIIRRIFMGIPLKPSKYEGAEANSRSSTCQSLRTRRAIRSRRVKNGALKGKIEKKEQKRRSSAKNIKINQNAKKYQNC